MRPVRPTILLALSAAVAAVAGLGLVPGAAGSKGASQRKSVERYWLGTVSPDPQFRHVSFYSEGRGKGGRDVYAVEEWGFDVMLGLTCDRSGDDPHAVTDSGLSSESIPKNNDTVMVGDGIGAAYGPRLHAHKRRFSDHGTYPVYGAHGIPDRDVTYSVTGRFVSAQRATGTVQVTQVWKWPDGVRTTCSGSVTWSACAVDLSKIGDTDTPNLPACAGRDPFDEFAPQTTAPGY
jgi:hypothetical protein